MDDPYSILNIYPDCTYDEARTAYKKAALMHHPDRHPPSRRAEAERRFRILANAFQQICFELGHPIEPSDLVNRQENSGDMEKSQYKAPSTKADRSQNSSSRGLLNGKQSTPSCEVVRAAADVEDLGDATPLKGDLPAKSRCSSIQPDLGFDRRAVSGPIASRWPREGPQIDEGHDDYSEPSQMYPQVNRRSSFSSRPSDYPGGYRRGTNQENYPEHHSRYRESNYGGSRNELYDMRSSRKEHHGRDDDWDLGLGSDDFFGGKGRSRDPFGQAGVMMSNIGSGFDNMMAGAFRGLSMAGPDPNELMEMDSGSCTMRVRQSKMVMGRTDDGSWAGKKMEKHMQMGNGRLEVSENAQDIRMGGRNSGSGRCGYGSGPGYCRNPKSWDPPPAYDGGFDGEGGERNRRDRQKDHYPGLNLSRQREMPNSYQSDPQIRGEGRMSLGGAGPMMAPGGGTLSRPLYHNGGADRHDVSDRGFGLDSVGHRAGRAGRSSSISGHDQIMPQEPYSHSMVRRPSGHVANS
ncbi:hypothetical protein PPACK8108_LOCUS10355 [Phakopsora pachyrhizi]|uniref:J domain-containing protein n=1 Tax=Phakopsora pachyrhizi TaxID=170000 RepID=A0AAV0B1G0_PHAPC|nr:hypothetical protein PPACK8108_LOCUS10355 [Phakopsora pachyrhizi]